MGRRLWVVRDGELMEVAEESASEVEAPFIIDDTMGPIRSMANGRVYDSKSRYMQSIRDRGLEVVGNDLLSKKPRNIPDKITEKVILDKIEKAEATMSDPTKWRAHQNRNMELRERAERLLNGYRR